MTRNGLYFLALATVLVSACGDDDNANSNDNSNQNGPAICGDGVLQPGELCDDGEQNSDGTPNSCRTDCRAAYCGDGVVDLGEFCDGSELDGRFCEDLGHTGGSLSCTHDCEFNEDACADCGNGILENGESCDGTDIGLNTCLAVTGQQQGVLSCNTDCTFETSACYTCGDGNIDSGHEDCDSGDVGVQDCEGLGYTGGLLGCSDQLCQFDIAGCWSVCGNGRAEPDEQCDGQDLKGRDCSSMGGQFTGGNLSCTPACLLSVASCTTCGNGILNGSEECDGGDFGGVSCNSLSGGASTGSLSCSAECRIDTSTCQVSANCGNGVIEPGEQCDGPNLAGSSCSSVWPSLYDSGELLCSSACLFDSSFCHPLLRCGNGVREPDQGEACDGIDYGISTCIGLGFTGGSLACTPACSLDTAGCTASLTCGNGTVDLGEECEPGSLGGQTCSGLGYYGGQLGCNPQCNFDTSACTTCGDGIHNGTEECDGQDLGGSTCSGLGYYGGLLSCTAQCTLERSNCEAAGLCGDGIRNGSEDCDSGDLDGESCQSLAIGFYGGTLGCLPDCLFNTWECHMCGNGVQDTGEQCDGNDLGASTCQTLGYTGGTLSCTGYCTFNPSACVGTNSCGDGIRYPNYEECDGSDFGGYECTDFECTASGSMLCSASCTLDLSDCTVCGDALIEAPDEDCEDTDLNGATCESLGYSSGTLACSSQCVFDPSNCNVCGNNIVETNEDCDDGNSVDWDGCNSCAITEFGVGTTVAGNQGSPRVAMAPTGAFVVVWQSENVDGDGYGIVAQLFSSTGLPATPEIPVNTFTTGDQVRPAVDVAGDGSFVVVWSSAGQDGHDMGVYTRVFDSSGTPITSEIAVNDATAFSQNLANIAVTDSGGFVVAWHDSLVNDEVTARFFDAFGVPITGDVNVSGYNAFNYTPDVAVDDADEAIFVWDRRTDDTLRRRRFDFVGNPLTGVDVIATGRTTRDPRISTIAGGDYFVAWRHSTGSLNCADCNVRVAEFDSQDVQVGTHFDVVWAQDSRSVPAIAACNDGRFTVVWDQRWPGSTYPHSPVISLYSAAGAPLVQGQLVNAYTTDDQISPDVARHPLSGKTVVVWESSGQDGFGSGVYAQRFNSLAEPYGSIVW